MASQTDVLKLLMEVEGKEKVEALSQAFEQNREQVKQLAAAYAANQTAPNLQALQAAEQQLHRTADALIDARRALQQTAGGAQAAGRGILELSRAAEDFSTGGFLGVLNNIPGTFQNFAQAAGVSTAAVGGLTAGVTVLATVAYSLYRNWDSVKTLWEGAHTETEAERMDRLASATHRTAEETAELNRYKKEQAEIEATLGGKPDAVAAQGKAVQDALNEGPPGAIQRALADAKLKAAGGIDAFMDPKKAAEIKRLNDEADAREKDLAESGGFDVLGLGRRKISDLRLQAATLHKEEQERVREDFRRKAGAEMALAKNDPEALRKLLADVEANPGAFPAGLAKDLADSLPENRRQQQEWEAQGKANGRAILDKMRRDKEQADRIDRNARGLGQMELDAEHDAKKEAARQARLAHGLGEMEDAIERDAVRDARAAHDKEAKKQEQEEKEVERQRLKDAQEAAKLRGEEAARAANSVGPQEIADVEAALLAQRNRPGARAAIGRDLNVMIQRQLQAQGHDPATAGQAANLVIARAMKALQDTQVEAMKANQKAIAELRRVVERAAQISAGYEDDMAHLNNLRRGQR